MLALLASLALAGPADRALSFAEVPPERAVPAAHRAARMASQLPRRPTQRALPRGLAWVSVGRLGVWDAPVHQAATTVLTDATVPELVRERAAWAVGELGRERSREDAALAWTLLHEAMQLPAGPALAAQLVEAAAKVFPAHSHDHDERLAATRALNALAAAQTEALPGTYYVLLDRVMTLDVAVQLVEERVAAARASPTEAHLAEATSAVLLVVRWLSRQRSVILASMSTSKTATETAFSTLLGALQLDDRRLTLVLLWTLGEVAGEPAFSSAVGPGLAALAPSEDPVVRLLHGWALYRLRSDLDARAALRAGLLGRETDPLVYRNLAALRRDPRELDPLQKLLGIEPPEEGP
jgi:hypothetical protein